VSSVACFYIGRRSNESTIHHEIRASFRADLNARRSEIKEIRHSSQLLQVNCQKYNELLVTKVAFSIDNIRRYNDLVEDFKTLQNRVKKWSYCLLKFVGFLCQDVILAQPEHNSKRFVKKFVGSYPHDTDAFT
jgi:hypothetical protein